MSYLHCHNCGWNQDDYWSKSYNPIRYLLNWEDDLLNKDLDSQFTGDVSFIEEHGDMTWREVIVWELEKHAKTIRNMVYRTEEERRASLNGRYCPKCKADRLDID